jgi:hypothetical protein
VVNTVDYRWVVFPNLLRGVVQALIDEAGSQRRFAKVSGIDQARLSRIKNAKGEYKLPASVLEALAKCSNQEGRESLSVAVLSRGELDAADAHGMWLKELTGSPYELRRRGLLMLRSRLAALRRKHRAALASAIRDKLPRLFEWFDHQLEVRGWWEGASRKTILKDTGRDPESQGWIVGGPRVELAYERVLAPFIDAEHGAGAELSWEECWAKRPYGARGRKGKATTLL